MYAMPYLSADIPGYDMSWDNCLSRLVGADFEFRSLAQDPRLPLFRMTMSAAGKNIFVDNRRHIIGSYSHFRASSFTSLASKVATYFTIMFLCDEDPHSYIPPTASPPLSSVILASSICIHIALLRFLKKCFRLLLWLTFIINIR